MKIQLNGLIYRFPKELKLLITAFLFILSIGYYSGLLFVNNTTATNPKGIQENYLGNENDELATKMKFKKSKREIISIVHTHILSMAMIFFFVGLLFLTTQLNYKLKLILIIEPFVYIILTFGGIYLLWKGFTMLKYIIIISGSIMTLSYTTMVVIIIKQLYKYPKN